jgi:outer membrane immunogenic protein
MMKQFLVPSIVLSAFVVSSAMAADLPIRKGSAPPPEAAFFDWSGLYIGGHIGYGYAEADIAGLGNQLLRLDSEGFLGGVQGGWNYQMGRFVLGAEVDFSFADLNGNATNNLGNVFLDRSSNTTWIATATTRLGYTWDRFLVYGKVGAAFAQFDYNIDNRTASETRVGFTVGTGLEWAVAGNWSAKAEYNYMDFGRSTVNFDGSSVSLDIDQRISVIKAGVNYRFGVPAGVPIKY